jgi:hypothetical protein
MMKKFDKYVDGRMKKLRDEIWQELNRGLDARNLVLVVGLD